MTPTPPTQSQVQPPVLTEDQRKSLELLQGIISRLSTSGFLLKGWAVTLVVGLLTFSGKLEQERAALLALLPAVVFWVLDAYLLAREHQFRELFEAGRLGQAEPYNFRIGIIPAKLWFKAGVMATTVMLYLPLVLVVVAVARKWL